MALLPPFYLDSVVAIGVGDDPTKRSWIATGFIFGKLIEEGAPPEKRQYAVWLVTNKHVLAGLRVIYLKFNSAADPNSKDYQITLMSRNGRASWVGHPVDSVDVAAIFLNAGFLKQEQRRFSPIRSDAHIITKAQMVQRGIAEGDRVFVLGFPMGLVASERQYVICRGGYLARIRNYLEDKVGDILIDAPVFPGNSGGPVILCPSALAITGTQPISKADLIGIVKSYVPYTDVALSQQTQRARITFQDTTGLATVNGVDAILETV